MANPMENMAVSILAKLTGMEPAQMQEMALGGLNMLKSADSRLASIEASVKSAEAVLNEVKTILDALGIHQLDAPIKDVEKIADTAEQITENNNAS